MPVVLERSGAVFLHPMKTGGTWVRAALTAAGVPWRVEGEAHADFRESSGVSPAGERLTIVRHPFAWYRSFWAYRMRGGWGGNLPLGHACKCRDLGLFCLCAAKRFPGFLTAYLAAFASETAFVMRAETLVDDLCEVLACVGEPFDEGALRACPRVNVAGALPEYAAPMPPAAQAAVVGSEWEMFLQWAYPLEE